MSSFADMIEAQREADELQAEMAEEARIEAQLAREARLEFCDLCEAKVDGPTREVEGRHVCEDCQEGMVAPWKWGR